MIFGRDTVLQAAQRNKIESLLCGEGKQRRSAFSAAFIAV